MPTKERSGRRKEEVVQYSGMYCTGNTQYIVNVSRYAFYQIVSSQVLNIFLYLALV